MSVFNNSTAFTLFGAERLGPAISSRTVLVSPISVPGQFGLGVTGQNIHPAGIYPGLKRPRLDYTRVYYGLGEFIPRSILWPTPIHIPTQAKIYHHHLLLGLLLTIGIYKPMFDHMQVGIIMFVFV